MEAGASAGPLTLSRRGRISSNENYLLLGVSRLADQTTIFTPGLSQTLTSLHGFGFSDLAGKAAVARTTLNQAYLLAADDIFWASGWICILLIGMVWLCKRSVSGGGTHAAAD